MDKDVGNGGSNASHTTKKKKSRWPVVERTFAIIGAAAALIVVAGAIVAGIEHLPVFEEHREEGMVSNLVPGDDYSRMVELIGNAPDYHAALRGGIQLYVFNRRWEFIQLLANSSGTIISVGIYAKNTSFTVKLVTGTVLNGAPINDELGSPIGATGGCGASWGDYYQSYELPAAGDFRSVIVGWLPVTDMNNAAQVPYCTAFLSQKPCITQYYRSRVQALSPQLVACLKSTSSWKKIQQAPIPIVIITAPEQPIIPDMLNYNYFLTLG